MAVVEYYVFNPFQQIRRNFLINIQHSGIDDGHVQPGLDRMEQEGRMHRFADRVFAAEENGNVSHPTASFAPGH